MATLSDDRVVINGRKADWISNGTIAEVCILYCAADTGRGPDPERGCVVIVPLDTPGVSQPIEKIFRDARLSMIEDGCNEVLAIKGGTYLTASH